MPLVTVYVCEGSTRKVLVALLSVIAREELKLAATSSVPAFIVRPPLLCPRLAALFTTSVPPLIVVPPA
jgi:hypothetical protein